MSLLQLDAAPATPSPGPRSWSRPTSPRWPIEQPPAPDPRSAAPSAPAAAPRAGRWLSEAVLTAAALLGLLVTGLTATAVVSGLEPLVVRSGSMEPAIATGGMVLVRTVPAHDLRVGDVVTVGLPGGSRVTHRIVEATPRGGSALLVLKGDANDAPDRDPVLVSEAGRLVFTLSLAGRAASFLTSAAGGFALGCALTAVALPMLRRRTD